MTLSDWQKNGWVKPHRATAQEIVDLLAVAERDLKDAGAKGLSDDWRFSIAYNGALQASTAALLASGYAVPKGESSHFRVIQSLPFTIGLGQAEVDQFDALHEHLRLGRRHQSGGSEGDSSIRAGLGRPDPGVAGGEPSATVKRLNRQTFRNPIIHSGRSTAPSLYLYGSRPRSRSKVGAPLSIAWRMISAVSTTPGLHSRLAASKPQL